MVRGSEILASLSDTAFDALERALDDGDFAPGDRLPAERDLARRLGVGRSTLRKALDRLERDGRLTRHVGRGTFVQTDSVVAMLHLTPAPGPADVMELRQIIEPQIAGLAALRASPAGIARLRVLARDAGQAADWRAWEAQDSALHKALAETSRNPLLSGVLDTLNEIRNQKAWRDLRSDTLNPDRQRLFTTQHVAVIDAITARSPQRARTAMRTHLDSVRQAMTDTLETEVPHDD